MRVRFAPSPTGNLHLGTLRTALFNWLYAKHHGGTLILRTEDTDIKRSKREFEESILQGLFWMGIDYDEGPDYKGDFGPYRQTERMEAGIYHKYVIQLLLEKRAYRCFCNDDDLEKEHQDSEASGKPYIYSRKCLHLTSAEVQNRLEQNTPHAIRFKMPEGELTYSDIIRGDISFDLNLLSDFVLMKSDGSPSYNFAVVIDDLLMEVTQVIRGEDHISNTPKQIVLFQAFEKEAPQYAHLPMILGPDKSKLSKRHGATNVIDYRDQGFLPEALFNFLALLGWSPKGEQELLSREELIQQFDLDRVSKSGAVFDIVKLKWMNGQYMRKLSTPAYVEALQPYLSPELKAKLATHTPAFQEKMLLAVRDNLEVLADINTYLEVFLRDEATYASKIAAQTFTPEIKALLKTAADRLNALSELNEATLNDYKTALLAETGLGMGKVFKPIRIAISGDESGPHILTLMEVLGKDTLLKRLEGVITLP